MRTETKYNKVVNIGTDGEITVLADTFSYTDGFKGARGHHFMPIPKSEYDEMMEEDNLIEMLIDNGFDLPDTYKRTGFEGMVKQMGNYEREALCWDLSYRELWEELREAAGLDEESAFVFNCTGGGRCFNENYQGNVNPELSAIIREAEKG